MTDWQAIVDQHSELVWSTVWRLVGNHADAADCFQDALLEAFKIARREPVRDWAALLRHLATVRALDLLRVRCRSRNRTEAQVDPSVLLSRDAEPGQMVEAGELAERLRTALAELPAQQAEVFVLCCVERLSYGEVAERLQLTTNAVGVLLHRARQRLRGLLAPVDTKLAQED